MSENEIIEEQASSVTDNSETKNKSSKYTLPIIFILIIILLVGVSFYIFYTSAHEAAIIRMDSYNTAVDESYQAVYDKYKAMGEEYAQKQYHVENQVSISITDMEKLSELEVLEVTDTEFVMLTDDKHNITAWYEMTGKGVFTVDMQNAEYIIDNKHHSICIRLPRPVLSNFTLLPAETNRLLFTNDIFNDSNKAGIDIANKAETEGLTLIKNELLSNPRYMENALSSAETAVKTLVYKFNPDIEDIIITVEFYE